MTFTVFVIQFSELVNTLSDQKANLVPSFTPLGRNSKIIAVIFSSPLLR